MEKPPAGAAFNEVRSELAHCPDDEHDGGEGQEGQQNRTSDLVLFSFVREMAFEVVIAHFALIMLVK